MGWWCWYQLKTTAARRSTKSRTSKDLFLKEIKRKTLLRQSRRLSRLFPRKREFNRLKSRRLPKKTLRQNKEKYQWLLKMQVFELCIINKIASMNDMLKNILLYYDINIYDVKLWWSALVYLISLTWNWLISTFYNFELLITMNKDCEYDDIIDIMIHLTCTCIYICMDIR